ncbi:hypothetical protein GCM10027589_04770 [Actinocorallia lasiicapitis]
MTDILNVTTATGTRAEALAVLRSAVHNKFAASGQVTGPVAAAWWHNGEFGESEEWVVQLKTTSERRTDLERHLAEVHPWGGAAEFTAAPVDGSTYYSEWVRRTTLGR